MSIITIVVTVIAVGFLVWLAETYIPMADFVKKIFRAVVIFVLVIWLLKVSGLWAYLNISV